MLHSTTTTTGERKTYLTTPFHQENLNRPSFFFLSFLWRYPTILLLPKLYSEGHSKSNQLQMPVGLANLLSSRTASWRVGSAGALSRLAGKQNYALWSVFILSYCKLMGLLIGFCITRWVFKEILHFAGWKPKIPFPFPTGPTMKTHSCFAPETIVQTRPLVKKASKLLLRQYNLNKFCITSSTKVLKTYDVFTQNYLKYTDDSVPKIFYQLYSLCCWVLTKYNYHILHG